MKKGPSIRTDQSGAEKGTRKEMTHSIWKSYLQSDFTFSKEEMKETGFWLVYFDVLELIPLQGPTNHWD